MRVRILLALGLGACSGTEESSVARRVPEVAVAAASAVRTEMPADQEEGQLSVASDSLRDLLPQCGTEPPVADSAAIGAVHLGMTMRELRALCSGLRLGWDWGDEGIPEAAAHLNLGGALVEVIFSDSSESGTITLLSTADPVVRTRSGLRVGDTVGALRRVHGAIALGEAECALYASSPALKGTVFRVDAMTDDCTAVYRALDHPEDFPAESRLLILYVNGRPAGA